MTCRTPGIAEEEKTMKLLNVKKEVQAVEPFKKEEKKKH